MGDSKSIEQLLKELSEMQKQFDNLKDELIITKYKNNKVVTDVDSNKIDNDFFKNLVSPEETNIQKAKTQKTLQTEKKILETKKQNVIDKVIQETPKANIVAKKPVSKIEEPITVDKTILPKNKSISQPDDLSSYSQHKNLLSSEKKETKGILPIEKVVAKSISKSDEIEMDFEIPEKIKKAKEPTKNQVEKKVASEKQQPKKTESLLKLIDDSKKELKKVTDTPKDKVISVEKQNKVTSLEKPEITNSKKEIIQPIVTKPKEIVKNIKVKKEVVSKKYESFQIKKPQSLEKDKKTLKQSENKTINSYLSIKEKLEKIKGEIAKREQEIKQEKGRIAVLRQTTPKKSNSKVLEPTSKDTKANPNKKSVLDPVKKNQTKTTAKSSLKGTSKKNLTQNDPIDLLTVIILILVIVLLVFAWFILK